MPKRWIDLTNKACLGYQAKIVWKLYRYWQASESTQGKREPERDAPTNGASQRKRLSEGPQPKKHVHYRKHGSGRVSESRPNPGLAIFLTFLYGATRRSRALELLVRLVCSLRAQELLRQGLL